MSERANVMGVGISVVTQEQALAAVMKAARTPGFAGYVTATSVHGVVASQDDDELKRMHNRSFLSLPDGTPLVWVARLRGHRDISVVYGPDFMRLVLAHSSGERHFLWGGGKGVAQTLHQRLTQQGAHIVESVTPPFRPLTPDEEVALVERLTHTRPHFVWVGLSTPKQERFMADFLRKYSDRLRFFENGVVFLGVGAAFDFLAGTAKEPPAYLRGTGLQWVHRMWTEPQRLGPRYLRNNPRFLWGICRQWLRPKRFPMLGKDPE